MTRKRYIKLLYALAQRMNQKHIEVCGYAIKDWGKALKSVQNIKFRTVHSPLISSYKEAWELLKSIREQYGM